VAGKAVEAARTSKDGPVAETDANSELMTCPRATTLMKTGFKPELTEALHRYPVRYDDVLEDVHTRLVANGFATKLDLAALIAWKHVRNAKSMRVALKLPTDTVEEGTADAFMPGLSDKERILALRNIPGFRHGGAFTSVLLTAWCPTEFGVFDDRASNVGWPRAITPACTCVRSDLPTYFAHLREIASELGSDWTPRNVDMALYGLASE
jgi:hypothetical protein